MELFKTYKLWPIEPVEGFGCKLWDKNGEQYLDLYGGHAVISIGHCHPVYITTITEQLMKLGFYSNAVANSLQTKLAEKIGKLSGYEDYSLFLCNSGAEANENAMKLASFQTGKAKIMTMRKAFHGRTSGAVAATDNPSIQAPFNKTANIVFTTMGDLDEAESNLATGEFAAVMIEGIQGVAGIIDPGTEYLRGLRSLCDKYGAKLILDEVQSGCGRTGRYYAHQHAGIKADIVTMAKGIANGFPVGAIAISPDFEARYGMLGTTFGGSHLACAAALAVAQVIEEENLIPQVEAKGNLVFEALKNNKAVKELRGKGLAIGIELNPGYEGLRDQLLFEKHIFTGGAGKNVIRLLPPLTVTEEELQQFIDAFNDLTK